METMVVVHSTAYVHDNAIVMSRVDGLSVVQSVSAWRKLLSSYEAPRSAEHSTKLVLGVVPITKAQQYGMSMLTHFVPYFHFFQ